MQEIDDIRVRSADAKRKQRKKDKSGATDKSVVKIQIDDNENDQLLDDDYFEDPEPFDESASFYSMKLSRPLLKAIENAKYSHPTPIHVCSNSLDF